ncbi:hypothetical protein [Rothia nasimurium]|uniref:hypothetical protein n=1 Tax=Rothia nasimurium TaxID=85336 RepID=UPI001F4374AB|nr:hypothetical protein [Rothia nasimurium]
MSEFYSAADLAKLAEKPEELNKKLQEIITRAYARARDGHRFLVVAISEFDPLYKPITRRLEELGYGLDYLPATYQGRGELTITW